MNRADREQNRARRTAARKHETTGTNSATIVTEDEKIATISKALSRKNESVVLQKHIVTKSMARSHLRFRSKKLSTNWLWFAQPGQKLRTVLGPADTMGLKV